MCMVCFSKKLYLVWYFDRRLKWPSKSRASLLTQRQHSERIDAILEDVINALFQRTLYVAVFLTWVQSPNNPDDIPSDTLRDFILPIPCRDGGPGPQREHTLARGTTVFLFNYKIRLLLVHFDIPVSGHQQVRRGISIVAGVINPVQQEDIGRGTAGGTPMIHLDTFLYFHAPL